LTALLRKLKTACAAGGTIAEARIEIQGDHATTVAAVLSELGYPPPQFRR
jgi:translation initiation factor 1